MKISKLEAISFIIFLGMLAWWGFLFFGLHSENTHANLVWGSLYQVMAWWGGLFGLFSARMWGWHKSKMGRTVLYFSVGLLLQAFGQSAFSYYNMVLGQEIPYPSIADIGYFSSVLFYIFGIISVARITGATFKIKELFGMLNAFIIPALMLAVSYAVFLREYEFDWSAPVRILLDFGYPLGEAFYVSIAVLAFILSRSTLGGIMRTPLIILMFALVAQYVAEFNFLTQALHSTWVNGGYGDVLYLFAYFMMTISLIKIQTTLNTQTKDI